MPDLDYGYEVTISTPATSDPAASTVTNQWQRQIYGNTRWDDIPGSSGSTYKIASGDRSAKIRLQQDLDGAKAYSNELQVTSDEFDPADGLGEFGNFRGDYKWWGGVLAPNGKIYGVPYSSTTVLEIDPLNQTTTTFGSLSGDYKWSGGVLAPNGKIYGIPFSSTTILEIDPVNQTTTTFGSLSGSGKWTGGVLAPNGKIYGIPRDSTTILEIDPVNRTTTTFGSLSAGSKWTGGVLAPNGKIYGIPYTYTTVLEIDLGLPEATGAPGSENWALSGLPGDILDPRSAYFNKL